MEAEHSHNSRQVPHEYPILRYAGDSALIVEFGQSFDLQTNNAALAFDSMLRECTNSARTPCLLSITETAPTFRSVLIRFDPLAPEVEKLPAWVQDMAFSKNWREAPPPEDRRHWRIPAVYGGTAGPDLASTADAMGCSETDLISAHAATRLRVLMVGFAPGFVYLGQLDETWNLPRLEGIKPQVPTGSISVAIRQTVMSATPSPTGWRTIARTAFQNFDPLSKPPVHLGAGDEISFEPVNTLDFKSKLNLSPSPIP